MEEITKTNRKDKTMNLFQQEVINNDKNGAIKVISDQDEKQTYTKEEVLNSVIWGDALKDGSDLLAEECVLSTLSPTTKVSCISWRGGKEESLMLRSYKNLFPAQARQKN